MINTIKFIDINNKLNIADLFSLLKTKSQKSNNEILSKLQNFNTFPDFCNYYINQDSIKYFNCLQKLIHDFSNENHTTSSFESTIEQYISCLTKIILLINLLFKIQEILNKISISSKNKLNTLKIKNQIENLNQESLFNLFDIFSNIYRDDFRNNSSTSTTISNMSSLDLIPHYTSFKNYSSEKEVKKLENKAEIYDKIIDTPRFELELNTIIEEQIENLSENNKINIKDSALTLSQYIFDNEQNNNNLGNGKEQKETDINKFLNLLIMINRLYKKDLINAEEKIKLKKMVLSKSIKIEKFYYDIYKNSDNDNEKLIQEIKKLF